MPPDNETDKQSTLLDYDLERYRVALHGNNVADNIALRLPLIATLLAPEEVAHLLSTAAQIKRAAKPPPQARKHTHPLQAYTHEAPLYCALSIDRRERIPKSIEPLLMLGQSLAILESIRPTLSKSQHESIAHFLHQLPIQSDRSPNFPAQFKPVITQRLDIRQINDCLATTNKLLISGEIDHARGTEYISILQTLLVHLSAGPAAITAMLPKAKKKTFSVRKKIGQPLSHPGGSWSQNPGKLPEDDTDDLEPTLIEVDVDNGDGDVENTLYSGEQTDEHARVFNNHGHRIRFKRALAGRNTEAFSETESYIAMCELVKFVAKSPSQSAARLLYILCALFGRHFDELGKVIMNAEGLNDADGDIIAIRRNDNVFTLEVRHILASRIPELPEELLEHKCRHSFELSVTIPSLPDLDIAWHYLTTCEKSLLSDRIDQLLEAKDKLKALFRKTSLSRFTETRLRGATIQAVFVHDYDLPKTQLIFSEATEASLAALHYISWPQEELQRAINEANSLLYKELLPTQPIGTQVRIGADKSQIRRSVLAASVEWFNTTQRSLRKLSSTRWRDRHARLVDSTLHVLGVGAAHRFNHDLAHLTINDLCLAFGLVIFRDKPAESTMYRRIAILPTAVIAMLQRFIAHLEFLQCAPDHAVPPQISEYAAQALSGEVPLFWHIDDGQVTTPNPRDHFKTLLDNDLIEPNICRHFNSSGLRDMGAPPLLIELHIGHHVRDPLLGKDGLISPKEFGDTMRPYLDTLLESFGYIVPANSEPIYIRRPYSKRELSHLHETEIKADRRQLSDQLGKAVNQLKAAQRRKIIDESIKQVIPKFDGKALPKNTEITKDQALDIRRSLIDTIKNDFTAIYRACRQLRKRLRILAETPGCSVDLPPPITWNIRPPLPITRAHCVAADQYAHLEQRLLEYCKGENIDRALIAKSALILWSHCRTYKEATIWLDAFLVTPLIKGADFQIIDLPEGESRTIGGIAYILCLAWLRHGATDTKAYVSNIFGRGFNQETIEATVHYAHWIRASGVIARALSGKLPHQELPRQRLLAYLYDQPTTRTHDISEFQRDSRKSIAAGSRRKPTECERLFEELRELIPSPKAQTKPGGVDTLSKAAPAKQVAAWRQRRDLPSLINLLARWAVILLGPHANQITHDKLHYDTVRSYLKQAWTPLFALFPNGHIEDLDADEMTDLLLDAIDKHDSGSLMASDSSETDEETRNISQAKAINRFFREMGEIYELPSVALPVSESSRPQIDANLFTASETNTIIKTLTKWSMDPQADTLLAGGLRQLVDATKIYSEHGLRRNELWMSRNRDFVHTEAQVTLLVRWHPDRTIKTPAGVRHFTLGSIPEFSTGDKRSIHHYDMLVDPGIKTPLSDALAAVLRHTTQDESARLHRFRHTVANKGLSAALSSTDVITKLRKLATLSADMGHAHFAITLLYYTHTFHSVLAREESKFHPSLSTNVLSSLFCESAATIRKKHERSSKDKVPVAARYVGHLPKKEPQLKSKTQALPPLIDTLRPISQCEISLKAKLTWILRTARNQDPLIATTGLGFSAESLARLANSLIHTQRQLEWAAIEESRLWVLTGELTRPITVFNEVTVHHKRFPGPNVDNIINSIPDNVGDLPSQLPLHLLGIKMTPRSIVADSMKLKQLEDCLSSCRIPMTISPIPGDSGLVSLLVDTGEPTQKHDANITRLLITGLIAHYHELLV
jgi:integrase